MDLHRFNKDILIDKDVINCINKRRGSVHFEVENYYLNTFFFQFHICVYKCSVEGGNGVKKKVRQPSESLKSRFCQ